MTYPGKLWFQEIESVVSKEAFTYNANPRINTLSNQIQILEKQNQVALNEYQDVQDELSELKSTYSFEKDIIVKERLLKRIKALEKVKGPTINTQKIEELHLKIRELQLMDQIKNRDNRNSIEREYLESLPAQTRVTGFVTWIVISRPAIAYRSSHYPKATSEVVSLG